MRAPAPQDPVALGMRAYVRATFRVRVFGLEHLRVEPGQIFAPSHRSDNDVPLLITVLYPTWSKAVAKGAPWPTFAAMIELFLPGFFAGYPAGLPLALRRALWPYKPGGVLRRHLQCVPVREPERMHLQELLRRAAHTPLDELLPSELLRVAQRPSGCPQAAPAGARGRRALGRLRRPAVQLRRAGFRASSQRGMASPRAGRRSRLPAPGREPGRGR